LENQEFLYAIDLEDEMKVSITFCIASLLLWLIISIMIFTGVSFDVTPFTTNLIHVQMYNM